MAFSSGTNFHFVRFRRWDDVSSHRCRGMPTAHEYRVKAAELLTKARERKGRLVDECLRLAHGYMRLADHADANRKVSVQQQQQPQPRPD
jgi:hypothetical protein